MRSNQEQSVRANPRADLQCDSSITVPHRLKIISLKCPQGLSRVTSLVMSAGHRWRVSPRLRDRVIGCDRAFSWNFTVSLSSISREFRAALNERCQIYQFRGKTEILRDILRNGGDILPRHRGNSTTRRLAIHSRVNQTKRSQRGNEWKIQLKSSNIESLSNLDLTLNLLSLDYR